MNKILKNTILYLTLILSFKLYANNINLIYKEYDEDNKYHGTYHGEFKNNIKVGIGKYTWADGENFIGLWKNDTYELGIYTFNNKNSFCGELIGLNILKYSVFNFPNEKYSGQFKKSQRTGFGTYYYDDGWKHIGEWKNDQIEGYGVLYNNKNIIVEQGKYKKGKLVNETKVSSSLIRKINTASKKAENLCKNAKQKVKEYLDASYDVKVSKKESVSNKIGGIGAQIDTNNNGYFISEVIRGYPAFYAGLKKRDQIYSIDDLVIGKRYNLEAIIKMISGKINTEVKIVVIRGYKRLTFNITRQDISALVSNSEDTINKNNQDKRKVTNDLNKILTNVKKFNKRIDQAIKKLENINSDFNKENYLEDIFNSTSIYKSETEKFEEDVKKLEIRVVKLVENSSNNSISASDRKKLEAKYSLVKFSLNRTIELLQDYVEKFFIYEDNKQIRSKYLDDKNKKKNDVIIRDIEEVYYAKNNVNLRVEPNVQSTIIKTIPQGGEVEVLRIASGYTDWVQAKHKGILGYVYFPLLSKEKIEPEKEEKFKVGDFGQEFEKEFSEGIGYLYSGDYNKAEIYFQNYIKNNPSSSLTGSAYYWLGETYLFLDDYNNAEKFFIKGYNEYPESEKAVYMLARLALTQEVLNKIDEACFTLQKFEIKFPRKFRGDLKEKLLKLNCVKYKTPDLEGDNILHNIYYNNLIKIKELIDLKLITQEDYEKRKIQIINQIINLDLFNKEGFLIKLLNENLITQDDYQYIFNYT